MEQLWHERFALSAAQEGRMPAHHSGSSDGRPPDGKASSGTEVPRIPLLEAIEKKTDNRLARSDRSRPATEGLDKLAEPFSPPVIFISIPCCDSEGPAGKAAPK